MPAPTLYARRGYSYDAQTKAFTSPTTFVSWDEGDHQPAGHFPGWHSEDTEIEWHNRPHRLVHVYSPSWRCAVPQRIAKQAAA
jgi:hypothetical protein